MFSVAIELGGPRRLGHYRPLHVTSGLRGYTRDGSQVQAATGKGKLVSITALAARFCPTGRDIFLEKRCGVDTPTWERSVLGHVVDTLLARLFDDGLEILEDAFEVAVSEGRDVDLESVESAIQERGSLIAGQLLQEWGSDREGKKDQKAVSLDDFAETIAPGKGGELIDRTISALDDLVRIETAALIAHVKERRRRRWMLRAIGIDWMSEVRATLARMQGAQRLDLDQETGKFLGVTANVVPDFLYAVTLVGDVKTGHYRTAYESVAVGYALFAEHVLRRRINTAAILSVDLDIDGGRVRSTRVTTVTPDDTRRRLWVTQRDMALHVIRGAQAPSHPPSAEQSSCKTCPYVAHCWKDGIVGGEATTPPLPGDPRGKAK